MILRSIAVILCLAVGALAAGTVAGEDEPSLAALLSKAEAELAAGETQKALELLEKAQERFPKDPRARVRSVELLLGIAKTNIASGAMGRNVNPFLRDAVDTAQPLSVGPDGGLETALRARLVRAVIEARFLLQELDEALDALDRAKIDSLPAEVRPAIHDLAARVHYAQRSFEKAAAAFEASGNAMAAASAYDAARKPEKSMPLYAAAIRAAPSSTFALDRAMAAVRFHKAHATLLAALEDLSVPEGRDGIPLLRARAELLEGSARIPEALPLLKDAAGRDEADPAPLVALGRLLGLQAMAGDAVDEALLDASADAYIAAIQRAPEDEAAAAGLGWLASQDYGRLWKRWRDARITERCLRVQRALTVAVPDDAWAWGNLGNTLRVLGQHAASLAAYAKAREANPYDPAILSDEGLALAGAGRLEDAWKAYEASVALDAGHLAGRQNAARSLYLMGRLDEAAKHLGAAARTSRAIGGRTGTYRFLMDRAWRAGRRSGLR